MNDGTKAVDVRVYSPPPPSGVRFEPEETDSQDPSPKFISDLLQTVSFSAVHSNNIGSTSTSTWTLNRCLDEPGS